jgi:hypothetical protein
MNVRFTITPFKNPYAGFIIPKGNGDPLAPMKRFQVEIPRPHAGPASHEEVDIFAPMKRYGRDVRPPRMSRAYRNRFEGISPDSPSEPASVMARRAYERTRDYSVNLPHRITFMG